MKTLSLNIYMLCAAVIAYAVACFKWPFIVLSEIPAYYRAFSLVVLSLFLAPSMASAAVDATVTTALTDAATDAGTVGALVLVVIVAIATFRYLRRAL